MPEKVKPPAMRVDIYFDFAITLKKPNAGL